jgi:DNA/RNA-binding domain of Phe-tRNA-synthetase-like protein
VSGDIEIRDGFVDERLAAEFPGLSVRYCIVAGSLERSPRALRDQLKHISNRPYGERAINMRRQPIAHAYRVFFRQIGLDPDQTRTPVEGVIAERLRAGRFASCDLVTDALTIAIVETGAALFALDADGVRGRLGLRLAKQEELIGGLIPAAAGTIVVADELAAIAPVFDRPAGPAELSRSTRSVAVLAIAVDGVPAITVDEGIWKCASIIGGP